MSEKKKQNPHLFYTIIISGLVVFMFLTAVFIAFIFLLTKYYSPAQNIFPQITIFAYDTPTTYMKDNGLSISATVTTDALLHKFSKGLNVKVIGTGGDGLRIHQEPGEFSPTILLASEGDLFIIEEGPTLVGGYIWWKVKSLLNEKAIGWAAEDFLQISISTP